jgi:hypothetical protein
MLLKSLVRYGAATLAARMKQRRKYLLGIRINKIDARAYQFDP